MLIFSSSCKKEGMTKEQNNEAKSKTLFAMDTVINFTVYTKDDTLLENMETKVYSLEKLLSVTDLDSEIYNLNLGSRDNMNTEMIKLIEKATELCEKSDGDLDITLYPVLKAWGFTQDEYNIPTDDELKALLALVDYKKVEIKGDKVSMPQGMKIDLGSVTKGYTGDVLRDIMIENGVTSAIINLGGNVQTLGTKPDASPWRIGIQNPLGKDYLGIIEVSDQAVITSGGYERYFEDDEGNIYWHILDPKTGKPTNNGLISVTVVGKRGFLCDGLSTALFVKGLDEAIEFWKENQNFEAIFITDDNTIYITEGIKDDFTLTVDTFNIEVITL